MKKRFFTTTMSLAMVFTAAMSGMGTLTVYATPPAGYDVDVDDGCYRGDGREPGGGGEYSWDISTGSDDIKPEDYSHGSLYEEYDNLGSSNFGGGSSYDGGGSRNSSSNASYSGGSSDSGFSDSSASYSAPAPKAAGSTTGVTGKENFHALAKSGSGTYKVTHKGIDIATFTLMDAESKKAVPCTAVTLKQRTDGKWAIDFQITEKYAETTKAADTTGLTVGAPIDRTYMYNTLGVSYVTINDTVVIDIEAEAAAAK